jgi:RNA polymerase sigma-70 factor (ECF subfamily)
MPDQDLSRLTDEDLMRRIPGSDACFRELVSRYERPIFVLVMSMLHSPHDAEEVTQEAFLAVYKNARLFNPELRLSSWVYTIASNMAKNVLRRRKRRGISLNIEGVPEPSMSRDADPSQAYQERVSREAIATAISSLRPKYSVVLMLRYSEGLSYGEISEQLGLSYRAVDTRLYRAKRMLKRKLERAGIVRPVL